MSDITERGMQKVYITETIRSESEGIQKEKEKRSSGPQQMMENEGNEQRKRMSERGH